MTTPSWLSGQTQTHTNTHETLAQRHHRLAPRPRLLLPAPSGYPDTARGLPTDPTEAEVHVNPAAGLVDGALITLDAPKAATSHARTAYPEMEPMMQIIVSQASGATLAIMLAIIQKIADLKINRPNPAT